MRFSNEGEFYRFAEEHESAAAASLDALSDRQQKNAAYYEGHHWQAQSGMKQLYTRRANGSVQYSNYNPDQQALRVIRNFTTALAIKLAAQTHPRAIEAEVSPLSLEANMESIVASRSLEEAISVMVGDIGYIEAARSANHSRTILGDYGIGLTLEGGMRFVGDEEVPDKRIRAFAFPITRLVLDPGIDSRDLRDHQVIEYRAAWTIHKIARVYPEAMEHIDESKLSTLGELYSDEMNVNASTGGRMYERLKQHSKTKAAWVKQFHIKGDAGYFDQMIVCIDGGVKDAGRVALNLDNPETPFGGCGLPFIVLGSHRREGSPYSISDVAMIVDDQNRANLADTLLFRGLHKYSVGKWLVDKRFFPGNQDEWQAQLNNMSSGFIAGTSSPNVHMPKFEKMPEPPAILAELSERERVSASDKVSRPRVTQGELKTHTPFGAVETALEQANQVGDVRVSEDLEAHARLMHVACGTLVKCVAAGAPSPLATLRDAGMSAEDLGRIATLNPRLPGMKVTVRQSAVRHRSHEARKADLTTAFQLQAMTPVEFRMSMARDLDEPLVPDDRKMSAWVERAAERVLLGEQWRPVSMGVYNDALIQAFRRAQFDRRAEVDPAAYERLQAAIQAQIVYQMQEMMLSQPPEPQPAQAAPAQAEATPVGGTANPAEALAMLGA